MNGELLAKPGPQHGFTRATIDTRLRTPFACIQLVARGSSSSPPSPAHLSLTLRSSLPSEHPAQSDSWHQQGPRAKDNDRCGVDFFVPWLTKARLHFGSVPGSRVWQVFGDTSGSHDAAERFQSSDRFWMPMATCPSTHRRGLGDLVGCSARMWNITFQGGNLLGWISWNHP